MTKTKVVPFYLGHGVVSDLRQASNESNLAPAQWLIAGFKDAEWARIKDR